MSPPSPEEMLNAVGRSMARRTGATLDEWVARVREEGPDPLDQLAVRRWLEERWELPQNSRWAVARAAARDAGWEPLALEEQIDAQYQGPRAALRPVFDALRAALEELGDDVTMEGRASYVPFVRRRQFAAVKAATRTRVDVGLRYTDPPDSPLLRAADGPGQGTHRLSLEAGDDVGSEVEALLRAAWEQNG